MGNEKKIPRIFLSYCWVDEKTADRIDDDFQALGIIFNRDIRDLAYKGSIKEFMKSITNHDFVFMLISKAYLTSINCLYEVNELLNNKEFKKKIIPIILEDADAIFNFEKRQFYYEYWSTRHLKMEEYLKKNPNEDSIAELKKLKSITINLDTFFINLVDLKLFSFPELRKNNYLPLFLEMNIEPVDHLREAQEIGMLETYEDKEVAIDEFLKKYPNNINGLFQKAFFANEEGHIKKSQNAYLELIKRYPNNFKIHYNYGCLLLKSFKDYETAEEQFLISLKLYPENPRVNFNLGYINTIHYENYVKAKNYYEKTIEFSPKHFKARLNLAFILLDYYGDFEGAIEQCKNVIEIEPRSAKAHFMLFFILKDREQARKHILLASALDKNLIPDNLYEYGYDVNALKAWHPNIWD